jgi:hypothetical protein
MMQAMMRSDKAASFKFITTKRVESHYKDDIRPLRVDQLVFPCIEIGAHLGVFDHLLCAVDGADAMVLDVPFVYYELNYRFNKTGRCDLLAVGEPFMALGVTPSSVFWFLFFCLFWFFCRGKNEWKAPHDGRLGENAFFPPAFCSCFLTFTEDERKGCV